LARRQEGVIVVENHTQSVAAPMAAPMTVALLAAAPTMVALIATDPAAASSRRTVGFSGRLMAGPAAGATAHTSGQVSLANANDVFIKVWAPPPRRVSL
jgi:hypothetical protein